MIRQIATVPDSATFLIGCRRLGEHRAGRRLRGEYVVVDREQRCGGGGVLERVGDHHGQVLTHVLDGQVRQRWAPLQGQVERQLVRELAQCGAVEWGEHVQDTGRRSDLLGGAAHGLLGHAPMRDLGLHEHGVGQAGNVHVGGVAGAPGHLVEPFDAADRPSHALGCRPHTLLTSLRSDNSILTGACRHIISHVTDAGTAGGS